MTYPDVAGTGEEFTEFVKRHSHDSIGGVKGFLDTVSVMNVNIDVQNSLVLPARMREFHS